MPGRTFVENQTADTADDPILALLTIYHDDLPEPMRFVRDQVDLVSRGQTFTAYAFDIARPGDGGQGANPARLRIDNLDQRIIQTIRALPTPPRFLLETVAASAPDRVEDVLPVLKLGDVQGDRLVIEADMVDRDEYTEPVCRLVFSPSVAPALFQ